MNQRFFRSVVLSLAIGLALCTLPVLALPPAPGESVAPRSLARILLTNAVRAGDRLVAVGEQGYIVYSDDRAQSWKRAQTPPTRNSLLTALTFADAQHGWAVGHDGLILASDDGGRSWREQRFEPDEEKPLLTVWFRDARQGIAAGAYGLYLETHDAGKTWSAREMPTGDHHLNAIVPFGDGQLLLVGEAGTILVSSDQGANWAQVGASYQGSYFGALALPDKSLVAYGLRGKVFRSEDAGQTWTAAGDAGEASFFGGAVLADGSVMLAGASGALRLSHDGGRSFSAVGGAASTSPYTAILPLDGNRLALFGENNTRTLAQGEAK